MGEDEIKKIFTILKVSDPDRFYSIKEISDEVKKRGFSNGNTPKVIKRLYAWGYLDVEFSKRDDLRMGWSPKYRLKSDYLVRFKLIYVD